MKSPAPRRGRAVAARRRRAGRSTVPQRMPSGQKTRRWPHHPRRVEHALGPEQRASTKLERYDLVALIDPAAAKVFALVRGGARFRGLFQSMFLIHVLRSWFPFSSPAAGASLGGGLKRRNPPPGSLDRK